ncbi:misacylated tRNA(Ala) deacylase [Monaibacterium marinum]|uniref:Misacylated tRNA(Ala) deacylase n=1 Tax=Pontivivens marinum TaxID=1690039 RepID=A0A2C9CVU9_9RHOB|nr:alanyl-tRNA editing protein [Monaibacterium marinum]SOH95330.1 misacylated tRNA(Ala) deacylase [Monaibacterium marinum]
MTEPLFRADAYLREASARVLTSSAEGIVLDRSIYYPTGGGQPGDGGVLEWDGGVTPITTAVKGDGDAIVLIPAEGAALPPVGAELRQVLDWQRRYGHMRVHTALHLLSVVIPLPVSGGSISAQKGRLDFDMPEAPEDKQAVEDALNALIAADHEVTESWITDAELDANPELVKTMSVQPPRGSGHIRLVRIGSGADQIDLQPCGGTHVRRTAEVGPVRLGKVEKKGRQNRRVTLHLLDS